MSSDALSQNTPPSKNNGRLKNILLGLTGIALFVALAFWGNVPSQANLGTFIAGIAACGAAWVGQTVGNTMGTANKQLATENDDVPATLQYVPSVALVVVIAFIIFFVATAVDPI